MRDTLNYYSTNSKLAYRINEKFYQGFHFVYCTPYFEYDPDPLISTPPSSSPKIIYQNLFRESHIVDKGGRHQITANKVGLKYGVEKRREVNIIDEDEAKDVIDIIDASEAIDFEPLLYIISHEKVKNKIMQVKTSDKANPFFEEYIIDKLTVSDFEIIEFPDLR